MKRPSFQFYPGDWLRDTALRSCSVSARGLWMDMLSLMHEGSPYGYLKVNSKVILPENLSRMVGATLEETLGWLSELRDAGVFSEDDNGIYSRRMVKDEEIRVKRSSGGIKGGNPMLLKVRDKVNLDANLGLTPSSSSSSSVPPNPQEGIKKSPESSAPTSEEAKRIAVMFNRRLTTGWDEKEIRKFKSLLPIDGSDLSLVEQYYRAESSNKDNCLRHDLNTFLNNFRGEVDRAGRWKAKNGVENNSEFRLPNIG